MSSWMYVLTNKGRQLQAKAQTGIELKYSRMMVGSGSLSGQALAAMTSLIMPVKNLPIIRLKHPPGATRVVIGTTITNADVQTGFYFREIGIYAIDPDDGEILYMYANAGATADYIAPIGDGVIEKDINVNVIVGSASNVTAIIDKSLVFVTQDQLEEELEQIAVYLTDASLTTKGLVQLSNRIDGTSEMVAATEKAVRDALNAANKSSLPRAGGALEGPVRVNHWAEISASSGGYVLYGYNCYLDPAGVVYRYRNNHANVGAKGIVFRYGSSEVQGVWMFDMGSIATTAGASFTPALKRILNTDDYNGIVQDYIRQPGYANTTGSGTAYAVKLNPVPTSLPDGFGITIVPHVASGASPTLNINSLGAVALKKQDGSAYAAGDLLAGKPYTFRRIGLDFLADSGSKEVINGSVDYEVVLNEDVKKGDVVRLVNTVTISMTDTPPVQTILSTDFRISSDGKTLVASNGYIGSKGPIFNINNDGSLTPYTISPNFTSGIEWADVWGDYMATCINYKVAIYKRTDNVYTKIADPDVQTLATTSKLRFTPDGKYLIATQDTQFTPNWYMYKRDGDTFKKMPNVNIGRPSLAEISPNGKFVAGILNGLKTIVLVKIENDTLIPISQYQTPEGIDAFDLKFTPDSNTLIVGNSEKPIVLSIKADGTMVHKTVNDNMGGWNTPILGDGLAISPDGKILFGKKRTSPYNVLGVMGIEKESFNIYPDASIPINIEVTCVGYSPDKDHLYIATRTSSTINIRRLRVNRAIVATRVDNVSYLNNNADTLGIGYAKTDGKKGSSISITRIF